jgi:hypothetical protein
MELGRVLGDRAEVCSRTRSMSLFTKTRKEEHSRQRELHGKGMQECEVIRKYKFSVTEG